MRKNKKSSIKLEGNYIDKIFKENCANLLPFIFKKMLGLKFEKIENLPSIKQQTTLEKEPDFLRKIFSKKYPKGAVVQLEFETSDDAEMLERMLLYLSLEYKRSKIPVLQHVLYLGKGKSLMTSILKFGQVDYAYHLHNIEDFSYQSFINSIVPEEVILTLLSDYENRSLDEILELIIGRLQKLSGDTLARKRFINQLIMLSRYRNLHNQTIKKIRDMGFTKFDVKTDLLYMEGKVEGKIEGKIEGSLEGEIKKSIIGIENMTNDHIPDHIIARYLELELSFVKKIQKQLLKKKEILAALKVDFKDLPAIAKKLKVEPLLVEILQEDLKKNKNIEKK